MTTIERRVGLNEFHDGAQRIADRLSLGNDIVFEPSNRPCKWRVLGDHETKALFPHVDGDRKRGNGGAGT